MISPRVDGKVLTMIRVAELCKETRHDISSHQFTGETIAIGANVSDFTTRQIFTVPPSKGVWRTAMRKFATTVKGKLIYFRQASNPDFVVAQENLTSLPRKK